MVAAGVGRTGDGVGVRVGRTQKGVHLRQYQHFRAGSAGVDNRIKSRNIPSISQSISQFFKVFRQIFAGDLLPKSGFGMDTKIFLRHQD